VCEINLIASKEQIETSVEMEAELQIDDMLRGRSTIVLVRVCERNANVEQGLETVTAQPHPQEREE
jgi:hypothetical protein